MQHKLLRNCFILFLFAFGIHFNSLAQPKISSFSPATGPVGSSVTITGTSFGLTPAQNLVYFGGVRATVTAASATSLTVTVPSGATFQPITVTTNNLTAFSSLPFGVTFNGAAQFTQQSFKYVYHIDSVDSDIETTNYAIGDLDNDGKLDIVTVDRLNNMMSIYRNTTTGNNISFATRIDITTGQSPRAISIGDIEGDGKLDIVVSNLGSNTVSLFKNTSSVASISLAPKVDFATATQPAGISIADLDLDGKPDLAINTVNLEGYVTVLKNTSNSGNISFASKIDIAAGGSIEQIKTADIDGDGKIDIVTPNFTLSVITIFRNTTTTGTISFASPVNIGSFTNPDDIAIGDLNNDSKPDIAVGHLSNIKVLVLRNVSTPGTITFQSNGSYSVNNAPNGLAIDDLDGDGKTDIVATSQLQTAYLFKNTSASGGSLTFNPGIPFAAAYSSTIQTGDFDNDGITDLTFKAGVYRVSVWRNRATNLQLASFAPLSGGMGETITISGNNFTSISSVSFGGVPASSFSVINSTTITAVLAIGNTGEVKITSNTDSTSLPGFVFLGPPVITSVSADSAGTSDEVIIKGFNFTGTTQVKFGGVAATFIVIDAFTIKANVGAGASGDIIVSNTYGTAVKPGFTYVPKPFISSFTPAEAVTGTVVVIKGFNFSGATSVRFGGVAAQSFTIIDSATIHATVANSSSGNVSVVNQYGTSSKPGFVFYPAPVINSFSPTAAARGDTVTIYGSNFQHAYNSSLISSVKFGGVDAESFTIVDSFTIKAKVNFGATGNVTVHSNRGNGSLSGFTFISPPYITSVYPTIIGPGVEVVITGVNFSPATSVTFGGTPASSFTIISQDTIVAIVGAGGTGYTGIATPKHSAVGNYVTYLTSPVIYQLTPISGEVGTTVTISGTNFSAGDTNNVVYFGGVKATVLSATANKIIVTVPSGANNKPVTVTSLVNRLTAISKQRFVMRFPVDTTAFNDSSFAGALDLATGAEPHYIKHADLDGDGRIDIIVNNLNSTFISIYRNISSPGRLSVAPRQDIQLGYPVRAIDIADVDGDGKLDLITSNNDFNYGVFIYRNQSSISSISFAHVASLGGNAGFIETGDLNFDGKPEIIFTCTNCGVVNGGVYVATNTSTNGTTSFETPRLYVFGISSSAGITSGISVTDYDNDGKTDIVVGMYGASGVFLLKNTTNLGSPIFFSVTEFGNTYSSDGYSSLTPRFANFDSQIYPHLLIDRFVYKKIGGGFSYVLQTTGAVSNVFDLNGDGLLDILGSDQINGYLTLIKNNSSGSAVQFAPGFRTGHYAGLGIVEAADLDGDSKPEIFLTYRSQNILRILRNRMNESRPLPPSVTSFTPDSTGWSMQVLITGSNFSQATEVAFGNVPAQYFTILSDDSIMATVGVGASGWVRVTTTGGKDSLNGFVFIPKPEIVSFTPASVIEGDTVTITGTNFDNASAVSFGGVPAASFILNSSTSITAIVGNGASGTVKVTTPGGVSTRDGLTINYPPQIINFTPKEVPMGGSISIYGNNFTGISQVTIGGIPVPSFQILTNQVISVLVGGNVDSGDVVVTNRAGSDTMSGFSLIKVPMISSFTPDSAGENTSVTIKGMNFTNIHFVSFNGFWAKSFTVDSRTQITAIVSNGASGEVSVTNSAGTGAMPGFTFISPPTITSFTKSTKEDETIVTIMGTNFETAAAVSFGGVAAKSFIINSATIITAVVGSGSSGDIAVTTLGGTAKISGFQFTPINPNNPQIELWTSPNPASDVLIINHPIAMATSQIRIVDSYGRQVKLIKPDPNTTKTETTVVGFSPGIYVAQWIDGDKKISVKFIAIRK